VGGDEQPYPLYRARQDDRTGPAGRADVGVAAALGSGTLRRRPDGRPPCHPPPTAYARPRPTRPGPAPRGPSSLRPPTGSPGSTTPARRLSWRPAPRPPWRVSPTLWPSGSAAAADPATLLALGRTEAEALTPLPRTARWRARKRSGDPRPSVQPDVVEARHDRPRGRAGKPFAARSPDRHATGGKRPRRGSGWETVTPQTKPAADMPTIEAVAPRRRASWPRHGARGNRRAVPPRPVSEPPPEARPGPQRSVCGAAWNGSPAPRLPAGAGVARTSLGLPADTLPAGR
jgi:hypothetical protein